MSDTGYVTGLSALSIIDQFSFLDLKQYLDLSVDNAWLIYATNPRSAIAFVLAIVYIIYYLLKVVKKPDFYCRESRFGSFILKTCPVIQEKFYPTLWCFDTHAQTAIANAIRGAMPNLIYKREIVDLPDGGQVSLDWYDGPPRPKDKFNDENRPIALFMPGLTGDSQTEYIKSLIPNAHAFGYRSVAFNNRGRGGMKLKTPRLYCAANCEDVEFIIKYIKDKYPKAKIVATGVSLGGIVLCRYLIQAGANALVDAAMLISVCYDLVEGCSSMSKPGLNMLLNQHLAKSLCRVVREQKHILEQCHQIDYHEVIQSTTLRQFDERFTIKMWNFKTPEHYYKEASNKSKLSYIKRPTLCINAADDMFAPIYSLPIEEVKKSSHVALVVTHRGGHIGFMEGLFPMLPFFSERLSKQYLSALIRLDDIINEFS
ncbi:protein ABHD1 [Tetranychus urticae]|uniref:AB hydrolase-1 domain-containing protein n=1 Tax=Tetranychus urticae TaxID=32264 RepID=T1KUI2_TETUR|nr:protein ABHD1 [Tetranychus urticae]